jgi:predicted RNA-binding Zn ribbon-like protein
MSARTHTTAAPIFGEPLPIELMNTIWADRHGIHDALASDSEALSWLRAVADRLPVSAGALSAWLGADAPTGLAPTAAALRRLRDASRRLAAEQTHDPRPAAAAPVEHDGAVAALNESAAAAALSPALTWSEGAEPTSGVTFAGPVGPALLALFGEAAIRTFGSDQRLTLRVCLAPGCVLYFAKEHGRREWCSDACGNRARAARHYQRTRHPRA